MKLLDSVGFLTKKNRKLYSDGNQSYLVFSDNKKFKNTKLILNLSNALKNYSNSNLIDLNINNNKYLSFEFNKDKDKKEIVINLEKFNSENFLLSFTFSNPKSKFDYKIGIDEKKRGIILNWYKLEEA